jgi:hypothetical protein
MTMICDFSAANPAPDTHFTYFVLHRAPLQEACTLQQVLTRPSYSKKFWDLCSSPDTTTTILRRIAGARYVQCMGEMRNTYNISLGKPQGKRGFGSLMVRQY